VVESDSSGHALLIASVWE